MQNIDFYIQKHAGQNPSKTAITFYDQRITYAQLLTACQAMAANLSQYNLRSGDVIAILCERNINLIILILAVLKLGCIYLPIDKLNPRQRMEYILSNSHTSLVITDEDLQLHSDLIQVNIKDLMGNANCAPRAIGENETDGFCIMYTSGTTGKPKGAVLHKAGVFNHLEAKIDCLSMDQHSVVTQNAGYYFVNSIWQIFAPLVVGAEIAIYDRYIMNDMEQLVMKMQEDRISVFQAVPTFWNRFFDYINQKRHRFDNLQCLVSTSEKLNHSLAVKCFQSFRHIKFVNAYGQTECSDDVLHFVMEGPPAESDIPIGFPIQNTRIYIINDEDTICSFYEKGEICVAGIGLSKGYLNAPDLTDSAFVKGSDLGLHEPYLYRTGDIGYQKDDSSIVYLGRKDYQVKINGFRVELFEIENVLLQYPELSQAAVIYSESEGIKKLIAFYSGNQEIDSSSLIAFLKSLLPAYMIPREFIYIEEFPLTAMEKIDRKKLHNTKLSLKHYTEH